MRADGGTYGSDVGRSDLLVYYHYNMFVFSADYCFFFSEITYCLPNGFDDSHKTRGRNTSVVIIVIDSICARLIRIRILLARREQARRE